jgi:hypothetical protein
LRTGRVEISWSSLPVCRQVERRQGRDTSGRGEQLL